MDIIFSANNNEEIKIIPVIPQDLPQVDKSYSSSSINTLYGELNLIGVKGLRSLTLESFFPSRRYLFMRPGSTTDYSSYIRFFEKWADERKPIRIVITDTNREILNMAVTVQSFTWQVMRNLDVSYRLELKEYVFVKVRRLGQ